MSHTKSLASIGDIGIIDLALIEARDWFRGFPHRHPVPKAALLRAGPKAATKSDSRSPLAAYDFPNYPHYMREIMRLIRASGTG